MALAEHAPNVLVTRTFSKLYGLAAERIGWGYAAAPIIEAMHRIRLPFSITIAGTAAAVAALGDTGFVDHTRAHNAEWRAWFTAEIAKLGNAGLRAVPSQANFVLVLFEGKLTAEVTLDAIARAGYAVRHLPGQGLPQALRITIGTSAQMDTIAQVIRSVAESA